MGIEDFSDYIAEGYVDQEEIDMYMESLCDEENKEKLEKAKEKVKDAEKTLIEKEECPDEDKYEKLDVDTLIED
jgi:hypothetical protein